jgi:VIT1/CCC1 family predicted Fe2+/Mn2+ transporter
METLFGLIMVLSFTATLSAATAGREEVRTMVFAALGCNLAWGIVDGVMYLLNVLAERGRSLRLLQGLRRAADPGEGNRIIAEALPDSLASVMSPEELGSLQRKLRALPEPPAFASLRRQDFLEALVVLLVVFASTFPPVIPFMIFPNTVRAMRISSVVALVSLFLVGYRLGKHAGHRPWRTGFSMMGIGLVLVLITIALGG